MGATPPSVWIPAFDWLKKLTAENTQHPSAGGRWCLLCEGWVIPHKREQHLKIHIAQREEYYARSQAP